jgi:hypothetical protein
MLPGSELGIGKPHCDTKITVGHFRSVGSLNCLLDTCKCSFRLAVLPPSQIVGRFGIFRFIAFVIYLDIPNYPSSLAMLIQIRSKCDV